jgi:hypothetical protein
MFFAKLIYEELEAIKTGLNQGVAGLQLVNLQVSDGISAQLDLVAHRLSSWQVRQEQSLDQIVGLLERQNTSFAYVMDKLGSLEGSLLNMGLSRCMRDINRSRRYRDLSEPQMQVRLGPTCQQRCAAYTIRLQGGTIALQTWCRHHSHGMRCLPLVPWCTTGAQAGAQACSRCMHAAWVHQLLRYSPPTHPHRRWTISRRCALT